MTKLPLVVIEHNADELTVEAFSENSGLCQVLMIEHGDYEGRGVRNLTTSLGSTELVAGANMLTVQPLADATPELRKLVEEFEFQEGQSHRKRTMVLAALRLLQQHGGNPAVMFPELFKGVEPLNEDELEELCQDINFGDEDLGHPN